MAADVGSVAQDRSPAHVDVVADKDEVTDHGLPVDPAPASDPAAGADTRTSLDIRHRTDERALVHVGARSDKAATVRVPAIPGGLAGVVFNYFNLPVHPAPCPRTCASKKLTP